MLTAQKDPSVLLLLVTARVVRLSIQIDLSGTRMMIYKFTLHRLEIVRKWQE